MLCFLTNGDNPGINKMNPMYSQVILVKNFSFGHEKGKQASRAWEIGTKFDFVKAQFNVPDEKPRGGYQSSITLGLNWYLNPNAMIMSNYVYTTGFIGANGTDNADFTLLAADSNSLSKPCLITKTGKGRFDCSSFFKLSLIA